MERGVAQVSCWPQICFTSDAPPRVSRRELPSLLARRQCLSAALLPCPQLQLLLPAWRRHSGGCSWWSWRWGLPVFSHGRPRAGLPLFRAAGPARSRAGSGTAQSAWICWLCWGKPGCFLIFASLRPIQSVLLWQQSSGWARLWEAKAVRSCPVPKKKEGLSAFGASTCSLTLTSCSSSAEEEVKMSL